LALKSAVPYKTERNFEFLKIKIMKNEIATPQNLFHLLTNPSLSPKLPIHGREGTVVK
jgi:hypothetical protein